MNQGDSRNEKDWGADETVDGSADREDADDLEFGAILEQASEVVVAGKPKQPVLGDYVLLGKIGSGGMGQVFKAQHRRMERLVALKMLPPGAIKETDAVNRFHREVKAAAKLFHPNIVTAFDAGEQNGVHYLVMEFVNGRSFSKLIDEHGPLTVPKASNYILQAAQGLAYAHDHEVVHRDIKPSNLILADDGTVKILDMGTARVEMATKTDDLTKSGVILGTVNYMSPEQARDSSRVDHRTDIYSLGCTLFFLLTGHSPFQGSIVETLMAHAQEDIPSLQLIRDDVPAQLDAVVRKMLAKDPDERYASVGEFVEALENCGISGVERTAGPRLGRSSGAAKLLSADRKAQPPKVAAVGIDVGASFARIAALDAKGQPITLANGRNEARTACAICIDDMNVTIGQAAFDAAAKHGKPVGYAIRRSLGQRVYPRELGGGQYPPEALLALLMSRLAGDAQRRIGTFKHVVVAVPGQLNETCRKSMQDAGYIAGLEVLDIINEPVAAALSYGHSQKLFDRKSKAKRHFLLFDLGGGKFDVAVLRISGNKLTTLSSGGDVTLGGHNFDNQLARFMVERFLSKHKFDPRQDQPAIQVLRHDCEAARQLLLRRKTVDVALQVGGQQVDVELSRAKFSELTADLLERLLAITRTTFRAALLDSDNLDGVLLAGGAARMTAFREMVERFAGDRNVVELPDDAVAQGAALYASLQLAKKQGQEPAIEIENISSHSVGVLGIDPKDNRQTNAILIPRNTRLPFSTNRTFKTQVEGQDSVVVHIVEGESSSPKECIPVGRCVIENLPPDLPAGTPVIVEFHYSSNGRLTVFVESASGQRATKPITRASGLTNADLHRWREWVETMMLCSNFF